MIFWFCGQSGSGKTTITKGLQKLLPNVIILDGDKMREAISEKAGFSKEDRTEHNYRVARLAKVLHEQNHIVLIAVIAPFEDVRNEIEEVIPKVFWIHVYNSEIKSTEDRPFEDPTHPVMKINTLKEMPNISIKNCYDFIKDVCR